jgi:hypothetical protein
MSFKFNNGEEVKDLISGFKGIIIGRCDYLTGCRQYLLKPKKLDKATGKPIDGYWFDEDRLNLVSKGVSIKEQNKGGRSLEILPNKN